MEFVAEFPEQALHGHLSEGVLLKQPNGNIEGLLVYCVGSLEIQLLLDLGESFITNLILEEDKILH